MEYAKVAKVCLFSIMMILIMRLFSIIRYTMLGFEVVIIFLGNWISIPGVSPSNVLWWKDSKPPKSCILAHRQCCWKDLELAKKECEKWDRCKYLQQTERDTPGKPGIPVWFARAEGQTGVDSEIVLWKRRGITTIL